MTLTVYFYSGTPADKRLEESQYWVYKLNSNEWGWWTSWHGPHVDILIP